MKRVGVGEKNSFSLFHLLPHHPKTIVTISLCLHRQGQYMQGKHRLHAVLRKPCLDRC